MATSMPYSASQMPAGTPNTLFGEYFPKILPIPSQFLVTHLSNVTNRWLCFPLESTSLQWDPDGCDDWQDCSLYLAVAFSLDTRLSTIPLNLTDGSHELLGCCGKLRTELNLKPTRSNLF